MLPRLQLFEITDQQWIPSFILEREQTILTLLWLLRVPGLQADSPASLASGALLDLLGPKTHQHVYVDYCAGSGGPTPCIAGDIQARLTKKHRSFPEPIDFLLTDISPHISGWRAAAAKSPNIHFISSSVDATDPPKNLLRSRDLVTNKLASPDITERLQNRNTFGLFFLAFHHFSDDMARKVLRAALDDSTDSGGFAIFELQGRTIGEILMILAIGPLMFLIAPFYFWNDPIMLFFIYIIPIIPLILMFDGAVSCLRTRTPREIMTLIHDSGADMEPWNIIHGSEPHTWPFGYMTWFAAVKK